MDRILTRRTPVSNLLHVSIFFSLYYKTWKRNMEDLRLTRIVICPFEKGASRRLSTFLVSAKKYKETFRQCPEAVSLGATPIIDLTLGHIHWFSSIHHISTCISIS